MPMIRTKQGDIIVIVQEIQNTHAVRYNINGVDLSRAKYLYIEKQNTSIEIPLGEYSIIIEGNDQYLQVDLGGVADTNAEIYQIIYEQTLDSSQYNPIGDADVDTLTLKYNEAQTDLAELWDAVANTSMKLDVSTQAQTLPLLGDGEAWYWDETEGQYKGIEIANVEINVDKVNEAGDFQAARITALGDQYVLDITTLGDQYITDMTTLRNDTETFRNEAYQYSLDAQDSADSIASQDAQITTNKNDIAALDGKIKFREYNSLADLGLVAPQTTQAIIDAMEIPSRLILADTTTNGEVSDAPLDSGTLHIIKERTTRVICEYTGDHAIPERRSKYIGSSNSGTWYGWKPIISTTTSFNLLVTGTSGDIWLKFRRNGNVIFVTLEYNTAFNVNGSEFKPSGTIPSEYRPILDTSFYAGNTGTVGYKFKLKTNGGIDIYGNNIPLSNGMESGMSYLAQD